jgi:hypothetical protein
MQRIVVFAQSLFVEAIFSERLNSTSLVGYFARSAHTFTGEAATRLICLHF